jgi:hypothetical protein
MANLGIYSLYWDNVDPTVVAAQKSVGDALQLRINQHRIHGIDHGEWIDWVVGRMEEIDVFLFLDIDCIPLTHAKVLEGVQLASSGALFGAEGAANHLDPTRSYAGPWYVYINRRAWTQLGKPSAKATPYGDVCQLWTDTWRRHGVAVQLLAPTHCLIPKWDLPGRKLAYGTATTYGEHCFHMFEGRGGDSTHFLKRCAQITAHSGSAPMALAASG